MATKTATSRKKTRKKEYYIIVERPHRKKKLKADTLAKAKTEVKNMDDGTIRSFYEYDSLLKKTKVYWAKYSDYSGWQSFTIILKK